MAIDRRAAILVVLSMAASDLASAKNQDSGPYCWSGKKNGKDMFIPCGSDLSKITATEREWLTLDLSKFAGLRFVLDGRRVSIAERDILTVLSDYVEP